MPRLSFKNRTLQILFITKRVNIFTQKRLNKILRLIFVEGKEILFFVSLNIPIHSYMYIPSSDKEGGNNDDNAVKVSRSKGKSRFEARFKFYKSRNQSVMEVLKLKSCQFDKAYFEVK